jgi:hypothetical protein
MSTDDTTATAKAFSASPAGAARAQPAFSARKPKDAVDLEIARYRPRVAPTLALAEAWKVIP